MAKKTTSKLHITTPNVKTVSLGGRKKQKASYIQLRTGFGSGFLVEDCREGAKIYEPLLDVATAKDSRFHIITAPTEEDGLRAVEYLAALPPIPNEGHPGQLEAMLTALETDGPVPITDRKSVV